MSKEVDGTDNHYILVDKKHLHGLNLHQNLDNLKALITAKGAMMCDTVGLFCDVVFMYCSSLIG